MHGWDPGTIAAWVGIGLTIIGAIIGFGRWLAHKFEATDKKNDEQLAEQRRIKRDLFGVDPDGGPAQTPLRDMMTEVLNNTRNMPERMERVEERQGKAEGEIGQLRELLIHHITEKPHQH